MRKLNSLLGILRLLGLTFWGATAFADNPVTPSVVNPISKGIYDLHMVILWLCVATVAGVFWVMIYSIIRHRKAQGEAAENFHKNPTTEFIWAGIPFAILILMAIPATKTLLTLQDSRQADLSIKVTGYECRWKYDYLEENISFYSNSLEDRDGLTNPVVVPTKKKIRFLLTSADVPHVWWVPTLEIKQKALSGVISDRWVEIQTPGTYRGTQEKKCVQNEQEKPIIIIAKTMAKYKEWIATQKSQSSEALRTTSF
jgi:cytochrome c oxidase subunit 2